MLALKCKLIPHPRREKCEGEGKEQNLERSQPFPQKSHRLAAAPKPAVFALETAPAAIFGT